MSAVSLVLFFAQRSFLFPIPTTARTTPPAAGFPEAEEHVLTTADGEKVIVWHVPARPGRPVILYFHGNGDFLAGFFGRFRDMIADGTGIVALSYRGYAGSSGQPSEQRIAAGCRRGLCLHDGAISARTASSSGAFRSAPALRWRWRRSSRIGKLILEAPYTSIADVAASLFWFVPVRLLMRDQFRSDERIARVKVPLLVMHGAQRSRDTRSPLASGCLRWRMSRNSSSAFPAAVMTISDNFGAIETARQFINAARG